MKKILFRADGNALTGLGHLYRIFALIEIFRKRYDCTLITRKGVGDVVPDNYQRMTLPEALSVEEEPSWLADNFDPKTHWIIADGYQFDSPWQKAIKKAGFKLLYVDDTKEQHMYADIVVNHALGTSEKDYEAEFYTRFALGTSYAILRPAFLNAAKLEREIKKLSTAFICFGGADPGDLSFKAAQAVINSNLAAKINVVLGGAYKHEAVVRLSEQYPHVRLHRNLNENDLVEVMKQSDFAIAPASTILYEICAVKMPVISGYYVQNQKNIYEGCVHKNLIFPAGAMDTHDVKDFEKDLDNFVKTGDWMLYVKAQSQLFDSKIGERFQNLLEELTYRKANLSDMKLVFGWANDKISRANSYFSEPIPFETHKNWFEKKLKDSRCFIYIAESENKPVGMVRYEQGEHYTTVGILVSEEFRGRGMALPMLKDTAAMYFETESMDVQAFIKTSNLASIKTFEKAGYRFLEKKDVQGAASFVYKLEKEDVR
ncbi:MAG: UDP-2,4-diacetamido-2,4,6-trideoxy-beta-L-altropyranose hydrolase [Bacteroidia bacterium]|nr:UDP-2,4-diacetamido-2,4,6-trideoxy-beta-L-altropyranose hydrolase [Bacteroidia bacterium]